MERKSIEFVLLENYEKYNIFDNYFIVFMESNLDKDLIDYSKKYWDIESIENNRKINYKFSVKSIQDLLSNKNNKKFYSCIRFTTQYSCKGNCGKILCIRSREHFKKIDYQILHPRVHCYGFENVDLNFCDQCLEKEKNIEIEKRREHIKMQEQVKKTNQEKFILDIKKRNEDSEKLFETAMKEKRYLLLNNIEYNLWIELAKAKNSHEAYKKIGLSQKNGERIFDKLIKNNLVVITINDDGSRGRYGFGLYGEAICNENKEQRTKNILCNKKEKDLFLELQKEHLYVYPKMPLREFLDIENIKDIFKDSSDRNYLLLANVDFLICDKEGNPLSCVEYNGGYHEDDVSVKKKDEIKNKALSYAGVPLRVFNSSGEMEMTMASNRDSHIGEKPESKRYGIGNVSLNDIIGELDKKIDLFRKEDEDEYDY